MNCYNQKCKKLMIKCLQCNKCQQKLCSNQCMIEHSFEFHQNLENDLGKSYSLFKNLQNKQKSLFIKKGEFSKTFKSDPLFDFNNFDFVKVGIKKQVLGTGAFGEVYLAKNVVNGCYYAIKHMHKRKITEHGANLEIVQREINIHKRLIHDNVIRMYSSYEDKKSFYLVRSLLISDYGLCYEPYCF